MAEAVYQIVFFIFTIGLLGSAAMVVFMRNPVRCILFLVLAFFCSAVLWMLLQAEFLSLVLIFVYVGAVMTLFLFVVMMINIDLTPLKEGFVRYLPLGLLVLILMIGLMCFVLTSNTFSANTMIVQHGPHYNNVVNLGTELFTHYIYEFELAGFILLSAMVAAISLAFYGRKSGTKAQKISKQLQANKASSLRIIKMKSESR
ncbi:MAG: NADH-quinone oxidoreductase subunit J [Proteobacteria bacterium]|nr:NADH-quinone oxidoreductase subunit J [Pseudomonadota bacterium]